MNAGVFLPLVAVLVGVAALSGTIAGTVINGGVMAGAFITAHVCAQRAGRWRMAVFMAVFVLLPVALALAIADATGASVTLAGTPAFEQGRVTAAGLAALLRFAAAFALLAVVVDGLASRFLPD